MLSQISLIFVVPTLLSFPVAYTGRQLYDAVPFTFTAYLGALIFFTLAYRLSPFHPLAKYPGPITAKMSMWSAAYIGAKGGMYRYYKRLHDRYGDVVRIGWTRSPLSSINHSPLSGPNDLSLRNISYIHPVLGQDGLPKGPREYISSPVIH
jgi:hypothetical protein